MVHRRSRRKFADTIDRDCSPRWSPAIVDSIINLKKIYRFRLLQNITFFTCNIQAVKMSRTKLLWKVGEQRCNLTSSWRLSHSLRRFTAMIYGDFPVLGVSSSWRTTETVHRGGLWRWFTKIVQSAAVHSNVTAISVASSWQLSVATIEGYRSW